MQGGLHHSDIRQRLYKHLEPYPHPNQFKRFYDKLIYVIALAAPLSNLPQLIHIWILKDASSVSMISWLSFALISCFWLLYGLLHKELPIVVMNGALLMLQSAIVFLVVIYS